MYLSTLCHAEPQIEEAHIALVALYLRGAPRPFAPSRRLWPQVTSAIREAASFGRVPLALRARGLDREAWLLEDTALMAWARSAASRSVSTVSDAYPPRWLTCLGAGAPPAVWARGEMHPEGYGRLLGVVGSRQVGVRVERFSEEVARQAIRAGYGVVTGGAEGCDTSAARGAASGGGPLITVLPCGLSYCEAGAGIDLALCAPDEPFSIANAMERNALIYAASDAAVIAHARFRRGGTWHGASDALRRRLTRLLVRVDLSSPAHRTLIALGGVPLASPGDLANAMSAQPPQAALFALG